MNKTRYYIKAKREFWNVLQSKYVDTPIDALIFIEEIEKIDFVSKYEFIVEIEKKEEIIQHKFSYNQMKAILEVAHLERGE